MSSRRGIALLLALAVGAGLAGCQRSGYQYIKSDETGTLFKVPHDWTLFSEDEMLGLASLDASPQQLERIRGSQWAVGFDSAPQASLENALNRTGAFPAGYSQVRVLTPQQRDKFSIASLRNEVMRIDELATLENWVEEIQTDDVVLEGGFRGIQQVYTIRNADGGFSTFRQISVVDPTTSVVFLFVIGCESNCFVENQEVIGEVSDSWTVKEL
jgi:hypothetical protein